MGAGRRPRRVFHLIKGLGRGGAEMLLPEGLRFSNPNEFEYLYGYFLPWKDAMVGALEEQGAEVICFNRSNAFRILLAARSVARHLRANEVDLLHCHMPIAGIVGRIAGRMTGVPVVYSEHNLQERFHPLTRRLNAVTWRWQQQVIAVSGDVAKSIRDGIGSEVPLRVVLNGVDVDRFTPRSGDGTEVRSRFGIPPDAPVVGTVAVFRTQKRLDQWIEAADRIHEARPDTRFLIVGDGPLRGEVEAAIAVRELGDIVHLGGLQEEIRPFLAAMNLYMMSSRFEGLPVALLEAMSMERAPVCTSVGGIPEVLSTGDNGILVEPGRPDELARAALSLLEDTDRLRQIGSRARVTVIDGFSMRRMAGELESIYEEVLSRGRDNGSTSTPSPE